jgi:hypothetical protein
MLVVDVESLARRHARSVRAIPPEQRFAGAVVAGFIAAFVVLTVLFTVTAEPTLERPVPELRTLTGGIHDDAWVPGLARQADEGFGGVPTAAGGP